MPAEIDTREELIDALRIAAELEHNLLVQYLFAAMSCRSVPLGPEPGVGPDYRIWRCHEVVRHSQSELYALCREEMAHLATVSNLLASIGAAPHFHRPPMEEVRAKLQNFPADGRPQPIQFVLEPFSVEAVSRFRRFEEPEPAPPPPPVEVDAEPVPDIPRAAPDTVEYDTVGGLYRVIRKGFEILAARPGPSLFVGAESIQDRWQWDAGLRVMPVSDLRSAVAAIDFIVTEGEGSPEGQADATRGRSHVERFRRIERKLRRLQLAMNHHVWPVLRNPATAAHRVKRPGVNMLSPGKGDKVPLEFRCAELFNGIYTLVLKLLLQFYDPAGESSGARLALAHSAKQAMSGILRPVAEVLVSLPATNYDGAHAGPPFEIYGVALPARAGDRWVLQLEQIQHLVRVCDALANTDKACARLKFIAVNLNHLFVNLDRVRA
jgi:hypothetical protein